MRGDQLAELVSPNLPDDLRVRVVSFHAGLLPPLAMRILTCLVQRGSIVIFVKSAAKGLTAEHLAPLRQRGMRIGLDSVDTPLNEIDFELFDFHIAASIAGQAALKKRLKELEKRDVPVKLLHHHYDPRLDSIDISGDRRFRCGYIGEPQNALIPAEIAGEVESVDVSYSRDFVRSLSRIAKFTLHYGVRPSPAPTAPCDRQYKPFTKGFTAAACEANILVNREADDAVALLGDDYPFLVSATDLNSVRDGLEHAKGSYAGAEWREGLDRMRALKELVTPAALAARLREIVTAVAP